jgi:ketosteroid isomerase-like protein
MDMTLSSLAARFARIEAVDEIVRVKHRYGELIDALAAGIDADDLERLGDLFTEDADVDFVSVRLAGREGVTALYGGQMQKQLRWLWHSFHSPVIEVAGDHATGHWTLQGLTIDHGATHPATVYGRYLDEFVLTDGRWRISKLQLVIGPSGLQQDLQLG